MDTPVDVYVTLESGKVDLHAKVTKVDNGELGIVVFYPEDKERVFYPMHSFKKVVIKR